MAAEPQTEDLELLERWQSGERTAGEQLFARYFEAVARFFRNKVDGSADDLVQRTFLGCLEGKDRVRGEAGFRGYLFGVARNVLRKHWRTRARSPEHADLDTQSIVELGASPSSAYARDRQQSQVLGALRRIPLDAQIVLELCYWEAMTAAEIGGVLGVPLGTAKTRIRRAKQRFAEELANIERGTFRLQTTGTGLDTWARGVRPGPARSGS